MRDDVSTCARWLIGEDGGCTFGGEGLRGEEEGGWRVETFPTVKTNASLAVRSSAQRQTVSAVVARDRSPAVGGSTLRHFQARPLRALGDWRGSRVQVGGAGRTCIEGADWGKFEPLGRGLEA